MFGARHAHFAATANTTKPCKVPAPHRMLDGMPPCHDIPMVQPNTLSSLAHTEHGTHCRLTHYPSHLHAQSPVARRLLPHEQQHQQPLPLPHHWCPWAWGRQARLLNVPETIPITKTPNKLFTIHPPPPTHTCILSVDTHTRAASQGSHTQASQRSYVAAAVDICTSRSGGALSHPSHLHVQSPVARRLLPHQQQHPQPPPLFDHWYP